MSKTLSELVTLLQSEVPAVNGVPTSDQYEQAIKDAVADFSRRCGVPYMAQLSIVSGTASYTLESDFIKMIWLAALTGVDNVIISSSGLIPVSSGWAEIYTVTGIEITFTPTPTYTMTRDYRYKRAWILTGVAGSEEYATMGDQEAQIIMLKAKAIAQDKQRLALSSSGGMSYSLGAVKVDKGSGAEDLKSSTKELNAEFEDACDDYNGAVIL